MAKESSKHAWFNFIAAFVDIGVGVFLAIVASRSIVYPSFQNVVLGIIEFLVGCFFALVAVLKITQIDWYFHAFYTYWGRGLLALVFGTLGLSGEPFKYIFSGLTIGIGLLWLIVGCLGRFTPRPLIDCTSGEDGRTAPPKAASTAGAPVGSTGNAKQTAGTAAFGDGGGKPKNDNPFTGTGGTASALPDNPFSTPKADSFRGKPAAAAGGKGSRGGGGGGGGESV